MADSFAQLGQQMTRVSDTIVKARRAALNKAALAAKQEMLAAQGAPRFLKGVGTRGAKVGVRYDVKGDTALVRWTGPAHLVNNPTRRHEIGPKKRGRGKAKKAILVNGQPRAHVQHPGTKGKEFFQKGRDAAAVAAPREYFNETVNSIRAVLR